MTDFLRWYRDDPAVNILRSLANSAIIAKEEVDRLKSHPIGTGPYKLVEFVNGQRYRLEANTEYFKGKPKVDQIDVPIVTDKAVVPAANQSELPTILPRPYVL